MHDHLEEGTLPMHSIFALDHAINVHRQIYGPDPMREISRHTTSLTRTLYLGLLQLRHRNGMLACRIYNTSAAIYGNATTQGATIAFNILDSEGNVVGYQDVQRASNNRNIFLRCGSVCNPGGYAAYLEWSARDLKSSFAQGHSCTAPKQSIDGKTTGIVRASIGAMTTLADIDSLLDFVGTTYIASFGSASFFDR
jgi:molybdenum cofactor sulfurtransferase